jgi:hypothetical protein
MNGGSAPQPATWEELTRLDNDLAAAERGLDRDDVEWALERLHDARVLLAGITGRLS